MERDFFGGLLKNIAGIFKNDAVIVKSVYLLSSTKGGSKKMVNNER